MRESIIDWIAFARSNCYFIFRNYTFICLRGWEESWSCRAFEPNKNKWREKGRTRGGIQKRWTSLWGAPDPKNKDIMKLLSHSAPSSTSCKNFTEVVGGAACVQSLYTFDRAFVCRRFPSTSRTKKSLTWRKNTSRIRLANWKEAISVAIKWSLSCSGPWWQHQECKEKVHQPWHLPQMAPGGNKWHSSPLETLRQGCQCLVRCLSEPWRRWRW